MKKPELLASASNEAQIIKLIAKYWCTYPERISLISLDAKTWLVKQDNNDMHGFRVVKQKNRLRFEFFDVTIV